MSPQRAHAVEHLGPSLSRAVRSRYSGAALALSTTLALGSLGCSGGESPFDAFEDPIDAPDAIRTAARAVVRISTARSGGTGSFISSDGVLLTNNHVLGLDVCPIEGCHVRLWPSYERGTPFEEAERVFVKPLAASAGLDMAVLQVFGADGVTKRSTPDFLKIANHEAPSLVKMPVHVVGHPWAGLKKWSRGEVFEADGSWFRATVATLPGNSGSPVLDDEGKLVGLHHRGATGNELVTEDGVNTTATGTASGPLLAARAAGLPERARSLSAPTTASDVVENHVVYLNARSTTAVVDGVDADVLSLLGAACDEGIAREYATLEDLYEALDPCYAAEWWIFCPSDAEDTPFHVCPRDSDKETWRLRFKGASDRLRAWNGEVWLDLVSFGPAALGPTLEQGNAEGRSALLAALADARVPLTLPLTPYLAYFGIDDFGGKDIPEYVPGYAEVPHYERSVTEIVRAARRQHQREVLPQSAYESMLSDLADDGAVDIGGKLFVEAVRYEERFIR